jgi:hypothetical protein
MSRFWNQSKNRMVDLLEHPTRGKEILDCCTEISSHNIPRLFEKKRRETIRPRSFIVANTEESFFDGFIGDRS